MIIGIIILLLFILCPFLGILVAIPCYLYSNGKNGIIYSCILGFLFGILAYYFVPLPGYDLVRDHYIINNIMNNMSLNYLIDLYRINSIEINRIVISYIVALTKNVDLLQFIIVFTGYSMIFYMLYDYGKSKKINIIVFIIIVMNIIFGFYTKYFFSGLFNLYAFILFAFSVYLKEIKKSKPIIYISIMIAAVLFHTSLYFAVLFLIIQYFFKSKIDIKNILLVIAITMTPGLILRILIPSNITLINNIGNLYFSYVQSNDSLKTYYDGMIFVTEITKFCMMFIISILVRTKTNTKINNYIILISIGLIPMLFQSLVMIRFVNLICFMGIVPLIDYFSTNDKQLTNNSKYNRRIVILVLVGLTVLYGAFFFKTLYSLNYGNLFTDKIFSNIFSIFNK